MTITKETFRVLALCENEKFSSKLFIPVKPQPVILQVCE